MSVNTLNNRAAAIAKRLEALLIENLFDDEFITLRVTITDKEGSLIRKGKISETQASNRGMHE